MDRKWTLPFDGLCRLKDLSASQGSSSEYSKHMASEEFDYQSHQNDRTLAAPVTCFRNIPFVAGHLQRKYLLKLEWGELQKACLSGGTAERFLPVGRAGRSRG